MFFNLKMILFLHCVSLFFKRSSSNFGILLFTISLLFTKIIFYLVLSFIDIEHFFVQKRSYTSVNKYKII